MDWGDIPSSFMRKIFLTLAAACPSATRCPLFSGSFLYPYGAKEHARSPRCILACSPARVFTDVSRLTFSLSMPRNASMMLDV